MSVVLMFGRERLAPIRRAEQIMVMPAVHSDWTVDMLDALPDDGQRYEIIDGVLYVTPAPRDLHQLVSGEFYFRLREYLRGSEVGYPMYSPADIRKGDRTRNRVQPDVFVVRYDANTRPTYPYSLSDLLLVIEVESPGNPLYDYQIKRELYLTHGVPEYWIANLDARVVSRWRSPGDAGEVATKRIEWRPAGAAEPLVIDLPQLFREALDPRA